MSDQSSSKSPKAAAGTSPDCSPNFSIDHEKSGQIEVPSITQLLNRKKLGLEDAKASPAKPQIREARRTEKRSPAGVELWADEAPQVAPPSDSLEGLMRSFRSSCGAKWVICLKQEQAQYVVRAVLGGGKALWSLISGFQWSQSSSPSTYQTLISQGWIELTPHSTLGDSRALRAALGLDPGLHLWLLACGALGKPPASILIATVSPGASAQRWLQANQSLLQKI